MPLSVDTNRSTSATSSTLSFSSRHSSSFPRLLSSASLINTSFVSSTSVSSPVSSYHPNRYSIPTFRFLLAGRFPGVLATLSHVHPIHSYTDKTARTLGHATAHTDFPPGVSMHISTWGRNIRCNLSEKFKIRKENPIKKRGPFLRQMKKTAPALCPGRPIACRENKDEVHPQDSIGYKKHFFIPFYLRSKGETFALKMDQRA